MGDRAEDARRMTEHMLKREIQRLETATPEEQLAAFALVCVHCGVTLPAPLTRGPDRRIEYHSKFCPGRAARPDDCNEPGCLSNACLRLDVPNPLEAPLPEGWTRSVVVRAPETSPRVVLRCPEHPLPVGGIVTIGGVQVCPKPNHCSGAEGAVASEPAPAGDI